MGLLEITSSPLSPRTFFISPFIYLIFLTMNIFDYLLFWGYQVQNPGRGLNCRTHLLKITSSDQALEMEQASHFTRCLSLGGKSIVQY